MVALKEKLIGVTVYASLNDVKVTLQIGSSLRKWCSGNKESHQWCASRHMQSTVATQS